MTTSELLRERFVEVDENDDVPFPADVIVSIIEAAEQLPEFFEAGGQKHSFVPLLDALERELSA